MAKKSFIILILGFSFLLTIIQTNAQVRKTRKPVTKKITKSVCKVGDVAFKCPEDFSKPVKLNENTILLKNDYEGSLTYLFVSTQNLGFDEKTILENTASEITAKVISDKSKNFVWKEIDPMLMDFSSKYQTNIKNLLGFNGEVTVNFISRNFSFNKKNILVGYLYDMTEEGTDAKSTFEKAFGGDNAIGCNALAETVYSITKEKLGKDELPCTLRIMRSL